MSTAVARRSTLPGFGLTMGLTLTWLSVIILIPLAGLFLKSLELSPEQFWAILSSRRTLNALRVSFGLAFAAACVNLVMGSIIVWALVRYRFPGRRLFDAIVDIPFALPTAVAGVALTQLFAQKGWLGAPLAELGIKVAFTPIGIFIAMIFIGIPFVVRTVQPVLIDLDPEIEEAAGSLGASRWQTIIRVILPSLAPALLTGLALAFARAVRPRKPDDVNLREPSDVIMALRRQRPLRLANMCRKPGRAIMSPPSRLAPAYLDQIQ